MGTVGHTTCDVRVESERRGAEEALNQQARGREIEGPVNNRTGRVKAGVSSLGRRRNLEPLCRVGDHRETGEEIVPAAMNQLVGVKGIVMAVERYVHAMAAMIGAWAVGAHDRSQRRVVDRFRRRTGRTGPVVRELDFDVAVGANAECFSSGRGGHAKQVRAHRGKPKAGNGSRRVQHRGHYP